MKFSINTKELVRVLSNIDRIVDKGGTSILSYVYLHAVDAKLILIATNGKNTLVDKIDATVEVADAICVKAHRFFQVMKSLAGQVSSFDVQRLRLNVKSGKASFSIIECRPPDEFPPYETPKNGSEISINNIDLRRMLLETAFSIMKQERVDLNGAHMEVIKKVDGNYLRLVTTDGNRLSISEGKYEGVDISTEIHKMLLPQKALAEILNLTNSYGEQLWNITFGQQKSCFSLGDLQFSFSLIDGNFPDYESIFSRFTSTRSAEIEKKTFINVLRRVSVFQTKAANSVRFNFSNSELVISIKNSELGDFEESVLLDFKGEPLSISFNLNFFQELLNSLEAERMTLEMDNVMSPCLIKVPERDNCKFVIMPMRNNN